MDGTYTGTVDRVVDETAVLLLEADGEVIEEVTVPVSQLPSEAQDDGGVLSVTVEDSEVVAVEYQAEETRERRSRIRDKLERLSERLSARDEE